MKKFLFSLIILILSTCFAYSQSLLTDDNIYIGEKYKTSDTQLKRYFIHNNYILSFKAQGDKITIQTNSLSELSLVSDSLYKDFPSKFKPEELIEIQNRFYFFYSVWKKKKHRLYAREINVEKCAFEGEGKIVIEIDRKVTSSIGAPADGVHPINSFDFSTTADGTKLLIQYRVLHKIVEQYNINDELGVNVFDSKLNLIWGTTVSIPYNTRKISHIIKEIDTRGNIYLISLVFKDNSQKATKTYGMINYRLELIKIKAETGELTFVELKLNNNKLIKHISLKEDTEGTMIAAGYSCYGGEKGNKLNLVNSVFQINFENNISNYKVSSHNFPVDIINQNAHKKDIKYTNDLVEEGKTPTYFGLGLKDISITTDGGTLILGEKFYNTSVPYVIPTPSFYFLGSIKGLHYCEILVTKLNKDGSLAWTKKIPKRQILTGVNSWKTIKWLDFNGPTSLGKSYKYFSSNGEISFIFMDHIDNLSIKSNEYPKAQKHNLSKSDDLLVLCKMSELSGEYKKVPLFSPNNVKNMIIDVFNIEAIQTTTPGTYVMEVKKKAPSKQTMMLKLELK